MTGAPQYRRQAPGAIASERMRYIIDLFRSRQRHQALLGEPFGKAQRAAILAGT